MADGASRNSTERRALWAAWTLAPAVALLAFLLADTPEAAWRYAGAVLELAGFGLVVLDLELRLERFGDRTGPILTALREIVQGVRWVGRRLGRVPPLEPDDLRSSSHITGGVIVSASGARTSYGPGLPGRVRRLENDLGKLERRVDSVEAEAAADRDELREEIGGDISELRNELGKVRADLQQSVSSGIWLETSGLIFFVFGVALGTWGAAIF